MRCNPRSRDGVGSAPPYSCSRRPSSCSRSPPARSPPPARCTSVSARSRSRIRRRPQLVLPQGANGIAAIVDGRLSVVTKDGFRPAGAAGHAPRRCRHTRSTSPPASATRSSRWRRTGGRPGHIPPAERSWRSPGRRTASGSRTSSTPGTLRPARHLRQRDPRHDDRPLGASCATLVARRLSRLRLRRRRRSRGRLRPCARVSEGRRRRCSCHAARLRADRQNAADRDARLGSARWEDRGEG